MNNSEDRQRALDKIAVAYEKHPVIRAIMQALSPIPVVSIIDSGFVATATRLREERDRAFFEELGKHGTVTDEHLKDKNFVHACISTITAARRTQREEKIKMFARLLANYAKEDTGSKADAFEQQLSVLDELSYLEVEVLMILDHYEQNVPEDTPPNLHRTLTLNGGFWIYFLDEVEARTGTPLPEIPGILERLRRTGLYQPISSGNNNASLHRGHWISDDCGRLTPNFDTLKRWITASEEEQTATSHPASTLFVPSPEGDKEVYFRIALHYSDEEAEVIIQRIGAEMTLYISPFAIPGQGLHGQYDRHRFSVLTTLALSAEQIISHLSKFSEVDLISYDAASIR